MQTTIKKSVLCVLLFGAMVCCTTGCMTSPGDGKVLESRSETVSFQGFLDKPSYWVEIQGNDGRNWSTIGYARSDSNGTTFDGTNWYFWSVDRVVPTRYWRENNDLGYFAEIRAIGYYDRKELYTFRGDFWDLFSVNQTVVDMYRQHGNGTKVKIYAGND